MKVFIASDLHTEMMNDLRIFEKFPQADVLVLAGDIGNPLINYEMYKKVLKQAKKMYFEVVFVAGNHEYYGCDYDLDYVQNILQLLAQETNTHFLCRSSVMINGFEFIGATLWSLIEKDACKQINDFRQGVFKNQLDYVDEFIEDYRYIKDALETNVECPKIVITHHLPTSLLIHKRFYDSSLNTAFYTNILDSIRMDNIKLWACGHTHETSTVNYGFTKLIVNPVGYPGESRDTSFSSVVYEV